MFVEEACARILAELERKPRSIRLLLERNFMVPRSLLHALCMGVLKSYRIAEEALRFCGLQLSRRRGVKGWTAIIAAYELLYRRDHVDKERLARLIADRRVLNCLQRIDEKDILSAYKGVARLAIKYSIPEWVITKLLRVDIPGGLEILLESFQKPPPTWIRYNKRLIASSEEALKELETIGINARIDPVLDDVLEVVSARPGSIERIERSKFYIMDRASCLVAHMANETANLILDLYSAPGNKLAHLLWRRTGIGVAFDLSQSRLKEEYKLLSQQNVWEAILVAADAFHPPVRGRRMFDVAIVDPDCSSIGRLGHSPETRLFLEKAGPMIVSRLASLQRKGLEKAIELVKRGGLVIYFTCTLTREENEDVVLSVAEKYDVEIEEAEPWIGVPSSIDRRMQRFYPHISKSIGGFAAKLRIE